MHSYLPSIYPRITHMKSLSECRTKKNQHIIRLSHIWRTKDNQPSIALTSPAKTTRQVRCKPLRTFNAWKRKETRIYDYHCQQYPWQTANKTKRKPYHKIWFWQNNSGRATCLPLLIIMNPEFELGIWYNLWLNVGRSYRSLQLAWVCAVITPYWCLVCRTLFESQPQLLSTLQSSNPSRFYMSLVVLWMVTLKIWQDGSSDNKKGNKSSADLWIICWWLHRIATLIRSWSFTQDEWVMPTTSDRHRTLCEVDVTNELTDR